MLVVALAGVVVTALVTQQLAKANRESMNIEGSFQHILTDLVAFADHRASPGVVILATGYDRADPIAALWVAAFMLYARDRAAARLRPRAARDRARRRRRRRGRPRDGRTTRT